ncbi:hypothetical protein R3P38DRAFT_3200595 [Favolaschia claudopus]|uniref:Uncharacterized protein n=1 Tax=Favolaschia claudopus TaxID=2862362 RepID=A0AAW0AZF3_9AGAR
MSSESGLPPSLLKSITVYILGAWDLGICGDLLLQGALLAQFAHFATLYHRDILAIRAFVFGLFAMTTLKSVQCLVILWNQNVKHFTDVMTAGNMFKTDWTEQFNIGLSAIIAFYVQLFFCQRLWVLLRNWYLTGFILLVFVFALVAAFVSGAFQLVLDSRRSDWTSIHLGFTVAGDILLTGNTVFYLLPSSAIPQRHSKEVLPETAGILKAILRLTLQSAAPAAITVLIQLITNQVLGGGGDGLNGMTSVSIMIPLQHHPPQTLRPLRHTNRQSGGRIQRGTHNVELGTIGQAGTRTVTMPIQVRTQVQTVQHSDVESAVYSPKTGLDDLDQD